MSGRLRSVALVAAGAIAVATAAVATVGIGGADEPSPQGRTGPRATASIVRTTLVDVVAVRGELSHGPAQPLDCTASGTVTWLPEVGTVVKRGEVLLRADEVPVILLLGAIPMYRSLSLGAKGADVRQLEENLRALSYTGFPVDDTFSDATVTAVKRWQKNLQLPESGVVAREHVVFASGEIRVASHAVRLGAPATGEVLRYTGMAKVVTVQADASGAPWAAKDTSVTVVLPGAVTVAGTVAGVGATTTGGLPSNQESPGTTGATIPVIITLADQQAVTRFEQTPVDVRYVAQERKDVLAAPVSALLALAEGGYGLEVVSGGTARIVPVTPGLVTGGLVEVSGDGIEAGMTVGVAE